MWTYPNRLTAAVRLRGSLFAFKQVGGHMKKQRKANRISKTIRTDRRSGLERAKRIEKVSAISGRRAEKNSAVDKAGGAGRDRRAANLRPNFTGQHVLHSPKTIQQLLNLANLRAEDKVLEIGPGKGSLTFAMAEQVTAVIAVEVDPAFVQLLKSKKAERGYHNIQVVQQDIRAYSLPKNQFCVVANIPFAITTPILAKLLGVEGKMLQKAALIVERGAAVRFTKPFTFDARLLTWRMFFSFKLEAVVPRSHFAPPPKVDGAIMTIQRRSSSLINGQEAGGFTAFAAYVLREPNAAAADVLRAIFTAALLKKVLVEGGISREQLVKETTEKQWASVFRAMRQHVISSRWPK